MYRGSQIVGEKIEYAQLGDCMIVATFQNGTMQVLTKTQLKELVKSKKKREEDRKKGYLYQKNMFFKMFENS